MIISLTRPILSWRCYYCSKDATSKRFNEIVVHLSVCEVPSITALIPPVKSSLMKQRRQRIIAFNPITKQFNNDAGLYVIPCKDYPDRYIGGSNDKNSRFDQYKNRIRKMIATAHSWCWSYSVFLGCSCDKQSRNVHERRFIDSALVKHIPNFT